MPESEAWVYKNNAGKRGLERGGRVPESKDWRMQEECRKARLGVWRKSAGKRGLESGGRVPESEAWSLKEECTENMLWVWRKRARSVEEECWEPRLGV